jgi:hypothetical protein
MLFELVIKHHEPECTPEQQHIEIVGPKTIPPADVVGKKQYRQFSVADIAGDTDRAEAPFNCP